MNKTILKLLANSNAFKDRDGKIWPKESILDKIKKRVLETVD